MILQSIRMLLVMTVLTGLVYPLVVTGISQILFNREANGSVIEKDGVILGSKLIGQVFVDPRYFWSRPSATAPQPYNGAASSGSNLGPTNPTLVDAVRGRIVALRDGAVNPAGAVPADLVTASGSGLDPHISPAAAELQISRVAQARGMAVDRVTELVRMHTEGRQFGFLGEARVNVLELNLSLNAASTAQPAK